MICASSLYAFGNRGTGGEVLIEASGERWIYQLGEEGTKPVSGPLGITIVRIGDGAAWIEDSPCRDKLCVASGRISKPGQWIACLPNKVFLRIGGESEEKVDAKAF
jgi:hypothetical protein